MWLRVTHAQFNSIASLLKLKSDYMIIWQRPEPTDEREHNHVRYVCLIPEAGGPGLCFIFVVPYNRVEFELLYPSAIEVDGIIERGM